MELYHAPRFRSTRVIILYKELLRAYSSQTNTDELADQDKNGAEGNVETILPTLRVHTFHDTESFRSNKPDWYLKMNPNGKVPYFRDFLPSTRQQKSVNENAKGTGSIIFTDLSGDSETKIPEKYQIVEIFESMAICTYLLNKYDIDHKLLFKSDPRYEAKYLQMSYFASGTIDNLTAMSSPIQRVVTKYTGETTPGKNTDNMQLNEKAFVEVVGPIMDNLLHSGESSSQSPYLCGSQEFGAIDAILAYNMVALHKRKGWLKLYCTMDVKKSEEYIGCMKNTEITRYTLLEYYKSKIATRKSVQEAFDLTEDGLLEVINY